MLTFKSNPDLSPISLTKGEFTFTFDTNNASDTDFHLVFEVKDGSSSNSFKVTNCKPSNTAAGYRYNESDEYTLKKKGLDKTDTFFNDELYYWNNDVYKLVSSTDSSKDIEDFRIYGGKTYVKTKKFSLIDIIGSSGEASTYVKRLNAIDNEGKYIRPTEVKSSSSKNNNLSLDYFVDENNVFSVNKPATYRIIVSPMGTTISILKLNGTVFEKIKTFSYLNTMENVDIYLTVSESMSLKNMSFSFFKSDVV